MIEKFKTLFFVKCSLISLYLALTIPLPFIAIEKLKRQKLLRSDNSTFMNVDVENTVCVCIE